MPKPLQARRADRLENSPSPVQTPGPRPVPKRKTRGRSTTDNGTRAQRKIVQIQGAREFLVAQLANKNRELMKAEAARAEFGTIATFIVLSLCSYMMLTAWMSKVANLNMAPRGPAALGISIGTVVALLVLMVIHIGRHHLKLDHLGLRLGNWRRSVVEGLTASGALFSLLVLLKWFFVRYNPEFYGKPVLKWTAWDHWLPLYVLVAPAQELLTRGFLQASIERLLPSKSGTAIAIMLASAQFGVMHLHYSFRMAVIAGIGSLVFGSMFARQRTLIGVSIAHLILGALIIGPLQLMLG
jgi:hypothetical protein